jgi:hypothetical protein
MMLSVTRKRSISFALLVTLFRLRLWWKHAVAAAVKTNKGILRIELELLTTGRLCQGNVPVG